MRLGLGQIALPILLALTACEDTAPQDKTDGGVNTGDGPFLPWKEGNTWTYRVTHNGEVSTKVNTILAEEKVGGSGPHADELAFKAVTRKGNLDEVISWQAVSGDGVVVRYREQTFNEAGELEQEKHWAPHKVHFDGSLDHTAAGASWLESYDETSISPGAAPETLEARDRWTVDSPEEEVTVPAGTFRAVVVIKASGSTLKTYWYVRGVGKVKETGGQTEELVDYQVEP